MIIFVLVLSFLLSFAAIADISRTPVGKVKLLPPGLWLLVVILVPYLGVLAWVMLGKPSGLEEHEDDVSAGRARMRHPSNGPTHGPDDDPEFLAALQRRLDGQGDD